MRQSSRLRSNSWFRPIQFDTEHSLRCCQTNAHKSPFRALVVFDRRGSGHEAAPLGQGGRSEHLVGWSIDEVAFGIEVIEHAGVDGDEFL